MSRLPGCSLALLVAGCGGGGGDDPEPADAAPAETISRADASGIQVAGGTTGVTPFIYEANLNGTDVRHVTSVAYVIEPKANSASKAVRVTYSLKSLIDRGKVPSEKSIKLPVFGLYAGHSNQVSISLGFLDNSSKTLALTVDTAPYSDPTGIYVSPTILDAREAGVPLGFDFFALKSDLGTPVVVDSDGEVRWVGTGIVSSSSSAFSEGAFIVGDWNSTLTYRLELDGTFTTTPLNLPFYKRFHHNIDPGKRGFLGEFDTFADIESRIVEFDYRGNIIKEWDLSEILSKYMAEQGDQPNLFVRQPVDWFHSNAAIYDPRDDSLLVSSRENFVIKLDYETGAVRWIFGDPTKYWFEFPSLRAKAVDLTGGGLYPVGQHALSINRDGLLLLFNNGYPSLRQPAGEPEGESRTYSAISAYRIDDATRTATEEWSFDHDQEIWSAVCSSVYEGADGSLLLNYAWADDGARTRIIGLNPAREKVFDFEYVNDGGCRTSWNAMIVPFENLTIG